MSGIFSSEPIVRILSCPNCGETMNTTQNRCPACSASIDPAVAEVAANALSVINQACSDATMVQTVLGLSIAVLFGGLWVLFRFRHVQATFVIFPSLASNPILTNLYALSLLIAFGALAALAMAARWWRSCSRLQTADEGYVNAKQNVKSTAIFASCFVATVAAITLYLWMRQ
jgi:hypothetical protein